MSAFKTAARFLLRLARESRGRKQTEVRVPVLQSELLKGRTALVTGGTRGIGLEIARAFLRSGADVCIAGRNEEKLAAAAGTLNAGTAYPPPVAGKESAPKRAVYAVMDVSDADSVRNGFQRATRSLGGNVDILVNNAGVIGKKPFRDADAEDFDRVLNTNLRGAYLLSSLAARHMTENKIRGNILNICSSSSLRPAFSPYTLSKWGLRGFTAGLAKALIPHGIVVNGLAPGPTATEMLIRDGYDGIELEANPAGRYATATEIANLAVVLVSGMGRVVVGDVLYATGGAGVITFDDMTYAF